MFHVLCSPCTFILSFQGQILILSELQVEKAKSKAKQKKPELFSNIPFLVIIVLIHLVLQNYKGNVKPSNSMYED